MIIIQKLNVKTPKEEVLIETTLLLGTENMENSESEIIQHSFLKNISKELIILY